MTLRFHRKAAIKAIKRNENTINFQVVGYITEDGKGKVGAGKTRVVGFIIRYWNETKFAALGGPVVTMFSAANTKLAVEHVEDIGARRVMTPFQKDKTNRLAAELIDNGHAVISMTRTMMHMLPTQMWPIACKQRPSPSTREHPSQCSLSMSGVS